MFTCIPQLPLVMTWQVYLHVSSLIYPQNINALFKNNCSHLAYKSQDSDLHSHHPPRTDPSTLPGMGQGSAALGSNGRCSPPTSAQPLPSPSNIFQHNLKGCAIKWSSTPLPVPVSAMILHEKLPSSLSFPAPHYSPTLPGMHCCIASWLACGLDVASFAASNLLDKNHQSNHMESLKLIESSNIL